MSEEPLRKEPIKDFAFCESSLRINLVVEKLRVANAILLRLKMQFIFFAS